MQTLNCDEKNWAKISTNVWAFPWIIIFDCQLELPWSAILCQDYWTSVP